MMKKSLILLLALLLALVMAALTACGAGSNEAEEGASSSSSASGETTVIRHGEKKIPNGYQSIPAFETENVNGDKVTNEIFADKDVTMINFWGTFCGPCIEEMPELQALSEKLPENAQIIGVLEDVSLSDKSCLQDGLDIIEDTGVTYENLLLNDSLEKFAGISQFVPTTVFVDSEGNLIGHVVIGGYVNTYIANFEDLLDGWTYE